MKPSLTLKAGIAVAMAAATLTTAQAAATTYFGNNPGANGGVVDAVGAGLDPVNQRNLFRSSLASSQSEAFDMSPGDTVLLNNLFAAGSGVSLTAVGIAETTSRVQNNYNGTGNAWTGRFNTTGDLATLPGDPVSASGWFETNKSTISIDFGTAVSAFGTFLTDVGDFDGALTVEVFGASGLLLRSELISAGARNSQGGLAFFGYTNNDAEFNKVLFTLAQPANTQVGQYDFVGFDDFITGPLKSTSGTVPEPTSLALVGLSLALLGCSRRRKTTA
jgi:hypothetical protein